MTGVESNEVTLMTVLRVPVTPVVIPFVQVTFLANRVRVQFCQYFFIGTDGLVAEDTGNTYVLQQLADDGEVSSTSIACHTMIALVGDIFILW